MLPATAKERNLLRDCLSLSRASAPAVEAVMRKMTTLSAIARLAEFLLIHPYAEEDEILAHAG